MRKLIFSLLMIFATIGVKGQMSFTFTRLSITSNGTNISGKILNEITDEYINTIILTDWSNQVIDIKSISNDNPTFTFTLKKYFDNKNYKIYLYSKNINGIENQWLTTFNSNEFAAGNSYTNMTLVTTTNIKENKTYKENTYYDLYGRIVEHPIKNKFYIYNGKKVVY